MMPPLNARTAGQQKFLTKGKHTAISMICQHLDTFFQMHLGDTRCRNLARDLPYADFLPLDAACCEKGYTAVSIARNFALFEYCNTWSESFLAPDPAVVVLGVCKDHDSFLTV